MTGLSVKTIMMNTVTQFIIFLYLCDNDTSWVIIISAGVGVPHSLSLSRNGVHNGRGLWQDLRAGSQPFINTALPRIPGLNLRSKSIARRAPPPLCRLEIRSWCADGSMPPSLSHAPHP